MMMVRDNVGGAYRLLTGAGAGDRRRRDRTHRGPRRLRSRAGTRRDRRLGAAGLALARAAPHLAASSLLVVVLLAGNMMLSSQSTESALAWLAPVVNTAVAASGTEWPCYRPGDASCELLGFQTAGAGWHLLYLAGLVGLLVALALVRDRERRLASRVRAAGLCAVIVAGILQIP